MEEILNKKYGKIQDENIELTTQLMNSGHDKSIILDKEIIKNYVLLTKLGQMKQQLNK